MGCTTTVGIIHAVHSPQHRIWCTCVDALQRHCGQAVRDVQDVCAQVGPAEGSHHGSHDARNVPLLCHTMPHNRSVSHRCQ